LACDAAMRERIALDMISLRVGWKPAGTAAG
jgi:hypothetical protein